MNFKIILAATSILLCFCFAGCKKKSLTELEKLPPATQTGANTFGCLVNGKAWNVKTDCLFICDPAFKVYYDGFSGGSLSLIAINESVEKNVEQRIIISFDSTNFKSVRIYDNSGNIKFAFTDYVNRNACSDLHSIDTLTVTTGRITLTRYDLAIGIVAGTFEFTLTKQGCETLSITNGRFDKKL